MELQKRIEYLPETVRPSAAANLTLWVIAAFFVLLLLFAAFTQLDRTVRANGKVIPDSRLQTVSNLEGGIVSEILVRTGQTVRQGAPIVRLDQTQSGAEFGSGQETRSALAAKLARLEAETNGTRPSWPAAASGEMVDPVVNEKRLYVTDMAARDALMAAASARLTEARHAVEEADSSLRARRAALDAARSELDLLRPLVAKGIEPQLSLIHAQSAAASAEADTAAAVAATARARAGVSEAGAALRQAEEDWRSKAGLELTAVQAELASRTKAMAALADKMHRTVIRAPLSGRVNRVLVTTVGGTVRPGDPIAEIVPDHVGLTVEAQVSPKDIAAVHIGQSAKVGLTAYDSAVYGRMDGKVTSISPDATVNERTGESYYAIRVRTNSTALRDTGGNMLPIGSGMVADVSLLGEKRSILSYLLTPITRLRENAFRE